MAKKETITLTWTKAEIELMSVCMSLHMPKQPVLLSAAMEKYNCPNCHSPVTKNVTNYCNECGQSLDWEAEQDWEEHLLGKNQPANRCSSALIGSADP